ncbi:hypothetical protein HJB99_28650 [Rhizobium sp. NLR17b]|uniref:thioredoxin family protein n=1 Tax=unclassified Rhizobium TaxID=2613769 RepID=UPI001C833C24|nr:hypothetical protein [Rhizobium sp. NLR17b]MBX5299990.1 hypothetical protein [Rhizobium sp. NLR12b]
MLVTEVDKENLQSEVLESEKPVLVDFWGDGCGPCKIIGAATPRFSRVTPNERQ